MAAEWRVDISVDAERIFARAQTLEHAEEAARILGELALDHHLIALRGDHPPGSRVRRPAPCHLWRCSAALLPAMVRWDFVWDFARIRGA